MLPVFWFNDSLGGATVLITPQPNVNADVRVNKPRSGDR